MVPVVVRGTGVTFFEPYFVLQLSAVRDVMITFELFARTLVTRDKAAKMDIGVERCIFWMMKVDRLESILGC